MANRCRIAFNARLRPTGFAAALAAICALDAMSPAKPLGRLRLTVTVGSSRFGVDVSANARFQSVDWLVARLLPIVEMDAPTSFKKGDAVDLNSEGRGVQVFAHIKELALRPV